ncbi:putative galactinol--sucrose galactosyltransferase 6 [Neolecta irregularis DAH-3]|uniref:Putative galactinol--sucrose galactosyltransferase 6 n=1 Tax=Neolecta irregularis (strain DAH-3) TaxID=1198029 RepID=A0A1U7LPB4_NEOID|nr:putative galactinol--sucrose galactosyltransferase 6 [Neolecta irregularis DAH-3]|eukprot:OLL24468.1 putative galactinol--sucrose galactosyltransferase 6 [Neolecta irregularis DAH-3]
MSLIILYPALGSVHIVESRTISFLVFCEVANISEIELFTNIEQEDLWKAIAFPPPANQRCHLRIDIPRDTDFFSFTLRYRCDKLGDWRWLGRDDNNGSIVVKQDTPHPTELSSLFGSISAEQEQSPETVSANVNTWTVSTSVPVYHAHEAIHRLGTPRFMIRYLVIVQQNAYWLSPSSGTTKLVFPGPVVYLLYLRSDGRYVLVLPLAGTSNECISHLTIDHESLFFSTKNDSDTPGRAYCIISTSFLLDSLLQCSFGLLRRLLGEQSALLTPPRLWASDLFYCTWESLGRNLSSENILAALQDLHDSGIRVRGIIIDDGWQSTNEKRQMISFEANANFPGGLKPLITQIRTRFRYINDIGVWHSIVGYWEGICPSDFPKYTTINMDVGDSSVSIIAPKDIQKYYDDYYTFLKSQGVSCVKVDVQGIFETINPDKTAQRRIWRDYQEALNDAVTKNFERKAIWCMSMDPKILYTSLLRRDLPSATFRNSDDYFPLIPRSHTVHVYHNTYNSILTGQLFSKPDWDMFITKNESGVYHAVSRCLSGSPVMITDPLGTHDLNVIYAMTIGKGRILRASGRCMPVDLFMNINDGGVLKIRNQVSEEVFALGLFNLDDDEAGCLVDLADFGSDGHVDIYYSYFTKDTGRVGEIFPKKISLEKAGVELLTGYSLKVEGGIGVACLGLVDKYISYVAVKEWKFSNRKITARLLGVGILGVYIEGVELCSESLQVCVDGSMVSDETISINEHLLCVNLRKAPILRSVGISVSIILKEREKGDLGEWVVV